MSKAVFVGVGASSNDPTTPTGVEPDPVRALARGPRSPRADGPDTGYSAPSSNFSLRAAVSDDRSGSARFTRLAPGSRMVLCPFRMPGVCGPWGNMRIIGRMLVPAVAEILCQRCGARTESVIANGRASVRPCPCGGMRQVVRVVHHRGREVPASPAQLERNVRHRSDEEVSARRRPSWR
jgi:hypothetical protein